MHACTHPHTCTCTRTQTQLHTIGTIHGSEVRVWPLRHFPLWYFQFRPSLLTTMRRRGHYHFSYADWVTRPVGERNDVHTSEHSDIHTCEHNDVHTCDVHTSKHSNVHTCDVHTSEHNDVHTCEHSDVNTCNVHTSEHSDIVMYTQVSTMMYMYYMQTMRQICIRMYLVMLYNKGTACFIRVF